MKVSEYRPQSEEIREFIRGLISCDKAYADLSILGKHKFLTEVPTMCKVKETWFGVGKQAGQALKEKFGSDLTKFQLTMETGTNMEFGLNSIQRGNYACVRWVVTLEPL